MPRYAIGDIQGCYKEFRELLDLIQFNPDFDKVYLVGDLVNRGPSSLEVLRFVKSQSSAMKVVLGNHDLHLLACWAGVAKTKHLDTLDMILVAEDVNELLNWLREQPLLIALSDFIISHAGVNPTIPFSTLCQLAFDCEAKLSGDNYAVWLKEMYGSTPEGWRSDLSAEESFRFGINSLTRMRMLSPSGLEFKFKGELDKAPKYLRPWFELPTLECRTKVIGHWSTIGLMVADNVIVLDTGCVWGGQLTAYCLDDAKLFQVPASRTYTDSTSLE